MFGLGCTSCWGSQGGWRALQSVGPTGSTVFVSREEPRLRPAWRQPGVPAEPACAQPTGSSFCFLSACRAVPPRELCAASESRNHPGALQQDVPALCRAVCSRQPGTQRFPACC